MSNNEAYRERSQELLADHKQFRDDSLRFAFFSYLDNFEGGNERVLTGELSAEQLAMMGIVSNVKMSDEGLAILRRAAAIEVDNWTADLRKKEKVLDELCAVSDDEDPVTLGRLLGKANHPPYPVNANHILDQLDVEFPERVFDQVKYQCERHERDRGKHYVKYFEK